ncbi:MAG TPA: enoyl-CoA hydratase/isomerase family protein [Candidatus Dormibacteraeota bacterium]
MSFRHIQYDIEPPLATITLHRPQALNAIDDLMMAEVTGALAEAEHDASVRVVILRGSGRCFSSGYDIAESEAEVPTHEAVATSARYWGWARGFWSFPKPIVASVHGYVLAGACEVAMLCDLTVASRDARFGEPEVRFASGPPVLIMPWIIGAKATRELLYTGKLIDAQRAYELGMVNEVCAPEELDRRTRYHALLISRIAPLAIRLQKESINRTYELMGLLSAIPGAATLVGILEGSRTDEGDAFSAIRRERGLKAALAWRDEQFREVERMA